MARLLALALCALPALAGGVELRRVPQGGIQPQVCIDGRGRVHLLYYNGDPAAGDLYYTVDFGKPLRVNRVPGSAIAVGNIRGAHLALGRGDRAHVAWNGSKKARPRARGGAGPMLYTRLDDAGTAFEPERNVITKHTGLDGGGSVAADKNGNVWVVWHAGPQDMGEDGRKVWVAHSADDGRTFFREKAAWKKSTGACGCCGLRAFADPAGRVYVLYRSATGGRGRHMYLLLSDDAGKTFTGRKIDDWTVSQCVMSSQAFWAGKAGVVATWESYGQVYFGRMDGAKTMRIAAPGKSKVRKHSVVATNAAGETILVWTEGVAWKRGGAVAWQVYDKDGKQTEERGRRPGVPVWSLVAVYVRPDGGFTILY